MAREITVIDPACRGLPSASRLYLDDGFLEAVRALPWYDRTTEFGRFVSDSRADVLLSPGRAEWVGQDMLRASLELPIAYAAWAKAFAGLCYLARTGNYAVHAREE